MAEYIERRFVVDAIAYMMATGFIEDRYITPQELQGLQDEMEKLPATDVAPVVHGRWIIEDSWTLDREGNRADTIHNHLCSECRSSALRNAFGNPKHSDYCPGCGAKMDLEDPRP